MIIATQPTKYRYPKRIAAGSGMATYKNRLTPVLYKLLPFGGPLRVDHLINWISNWIETDDLYSSFSPAKPVADRIFDYGTSIIITSDGRQRVKWLAVVDKYHRWSVYAAPEQATWDYVYNNGTRLSDKVLVNSIVPSDWEAQQLYKG